MVGREGGRRTRYRHISHLPALMHNAWWMHRNNNEVAAWMDVAVEARKQRGFRPRSRPRDPRAPQKGNAECCDLWALVFLDWFSSQVHSPMSAPSARLPRYAYVSPTLAARHAKDTEEGLYDLLPGEVFWKNRYLFLHDRGYTLRPRYHPNWKPSWIGTNRKPMFCEDSIMLNARTYRYSSGHEYIAD